MKNELETLKLNQKVTYTIKAPDLAVTLLCLECLDLVLA